MATGSPPLPSSQAETGLRYWVGEFIMEKVVYWGFYYEKLQTNTKIEFKEVPLAIQKLKAFLYTSNEISEIETREKIPFTITTKRIKYWDKLYQGDKTCTQKTTEH